MPFGTCDRARSRPLRWLFGLDAILRSEGRHAVGVGAVPWVRIGLWTLAGGAAYGAAMGSFGSKLEGSVYSAIKVPVLLGGSLAICMPFFFVLNAALGLRVDFSAAVRGVLSAQATLGIALASLAPVTLVLYSTTPSYPTALLQNAGAFAAASCAAQVTLVRHYRPLLARSRNHGVGLAAWGVLYAFVAVKLAWILRPFVGDPALQTVLFRRGAFDENPYVLLFWTVAGFLWKAWKTLAEV